MKHKKNSKRCYICEDVIMQGIHCDECCVRYKVSAFASTRYVEPSDSLWADPPKEPPDFDAQINLPLGWGNE